MVKKGVKLTIKVAISAIVLLLLFSKIGIKKPLLLLKDANLLLVALIAIIAIIILIIGALNIKILTNKLNNKISFWKMFYYFTTSQSIGNLMPGKFGELSILHFLRKEGIKIGESSAIYIIDKIISLLILILASLIGIFIFLKLLKAETIIIIIILTLLIIFSILLHKSIFKLIKKILGKYSERFEGFQKTLSFYLISSKKELSYNLILSVFRLIASSYVIILAFKALDPNFEINFFYVIFIHGISSIVSLIPISISGLGIRQSLAVILFSYLKVDPALSLSAYLLLLIYKVVFTALFMLMYIVKGNYQTSS